MWPFTGSTPGKVSARRIDADYAVSGQVLPQHIPALFAEGYRALICARPDNEEPGQPSFAEVKAAAEAAGMKAVHIPVSGMLTEGSLIRMEQALADLPRPILAYCRSGARAGSLYAAAKR